MEGCRQRRLGSEEDHSTSKGNYKTDLTLTGLLMEGLGLGGRCCCQLRWVQFFTLGTFCFSSSNQLSTTLICVLNVACSMSFTIRNLWPSRETS
jgi:hypothetical protein